MRSRVSGGLVGPLAALGMMGLGWGERTSNGNGKGKDKDNSNDNGKGNSNCKDNSNSKGEIQGSLHYGGKVRRLRSR
jgi:hypothetical protein